MSGKEKTVSAGRKSAAQHLKDRGAVEQPVFVVVKAPEFVLNAYRVVLLKNLDAKDSSIVIDEVTYFKVLTQESTTNAQKLRNFCAEQNAILQKNYDIKQTNIAKERDLNRIRREQAEKQERAEGNRNARIILREMAIMNRKMEEVETGERHL